MGTLLHQCWCVPLQPAPHWPALLVSLLHFANCLLDGSTDCICCNVCTSVQQHARRCCKACTAYSSHSATALFEQVMQCCLLDLEAPFWACCWICTFCPFAYLYCAKASKHLLCAALHRGIHLDLSVTSHTHTSSRQHANRARDRTQRPTEAYISDLSVTSHTYAC